MTSSQFPFLSTLMMTVNTNTTTLTSSPTKKKKFIPSFDEEITTSTISSVVYDKEETLYNGNNDDDLVTKTKTTMGHRIPGYHPTNEWQISLIPLKGTSDPTLGVILRVDQSHESRLDELFKKHKLPYLKRQSALLLYEREYLFDAKGYEIVDNVVQLSGISSQEGRGFLRLSNDLKQILSRQFDPNTFRSWSEKEMTKRWQQLPPLLVTELKPFQKLGVEFLWKHGNRGMISDEMGLGKTIQAITFMISMRILHGNYEPLLIISPKSSAGNWVQELYKRDSFLQEGDIVILKTGAVAQKYLPAVIRAAEYRKQQLEVNIGMRKRPISKYGEKQEQEEEQELDNDDDDDISVTTSTTTTTSISTKRQKLSQTDKGIPQYHRVAKKRRQKQPADRVYPVYFISYGLVKGKNVFPLLKKSRFQKIIMDESQSLKNFETNQTEACFALATSKHCQSLVLLSGKTLIG